MSTWTCALELDEGRKVTSGSESALCEAIRKGSELRIGLGFAHNEHIDLESPNSEFIREVMDFRIAYLLEDRWTAAIHLRMPVSIPGGFGPRASFSFFIYNQDGTQACGRPYLDGMPPQGYAMDQHPEPDSGKMQKMHYLDSFDYQTNAPSINFIYDFNMYRFMVHDEWEQVLAHDADGRVQSGNVETLAEAVYQGYEVKVGIRGLCDDLAVNEPAMDHEVFVPVGPCYYYTETKLLMGEGNPMVRVRPAIPLLYGSHNWDFGCLFPRTDGLVARWMCDPYTLQFQKSESHHAIRWFVRR